MDVSQMSSIPVAMDDATLERAQQEARSRACEGEKDLRLIAWFDRERNTGGPEPACKGEPPKCVRDYAASHGGECRVMVNDGEYEFYFGRTGPDVEELDPEWVQRVHEGLDTDEFDNVQGG